MKSLEKGYTLEPPKKTPLRRVGGVVGLVAAIGLGGNYLQNRHKNENTIESLAHNESGNARSVITDHDRKKARTLMQLFQKLTELQSSLVQDESEHERWLEEQQKAHEKKLQLKELARDDLKFFLTEYSKSLILCYILRLCRELIGTPVNTWRLAKYIDKAEIIKILLRLSIRGRMELINLPPVTSSILLLMKT